MLQSKVKEQLCGAIIGVLMECTTSCCRREILLFSSFPSHCALAPAQNALLILWPGGSSRSSGSNITTKITGGIFS